MTQYKIYRHICNELNILFPLKESEIVTLVNPIPNTLEFQNKEDRKNLTYTDYNNRLTERAMLYYKVCKIVGTEKIEKFTKENSTFKLRSSEHPDRKVNLHTVISVLYLSGFRDNDLITRTLKYINN